MTGQPPASGATLGEVFSKIRAGNLPRARELEPTIAGPLDAICAKALGGIASIVTAAQDVAEDVRRWLLDEPVSVYRDPMTVRLMRFSRRHRTLVTSLAALFFTALIGLSVGVVLIERERARTDQQRGIALEQKRLAIANADTALQNFRLAQNATDSLLGEVADVDLADIPQMEPVR